MSCVDDFDSCGFKVGDLGGVHVDGVVDSGVRVLLVVLGVEGGV